MLHRSVTNFANDLSDISERIKGRTVGQIKTALKKKAFEDAGMPLSAQNVLSREASATPVSQGGAQNAAAPASPGGIMSKTSSEVTLNMLNASENEVTTAEAYELGCGTNASDVKI